MCLHGHDIDPTTSPAEAGLLWAIPKSVRETGTFIGAKALTEQIAAVRRGAAWAWHLPDVSRFGLARSSSMRRARKSAP